MNSQTLALICIALGIFRISWTLGKGHKGPCGRSDDTNTLLNDLIAAREEIAQLKAAINSLNISGKM